jgi:hypothetical protein
MLFELTAQGHEKEFLNLLDKAEKEKKEALFNKHPRNNRIFYNKKRSGFRKYCDTVTLIKF